MDPSEVHDTIKALDRTLCALEASGISKHMIIGVLAGVLETRVKSERPDYQVAIRTVLAEKFGKAAA